MTCSCALAAAVDRCQTAPADMRLTQWLPEIRVIKIRISGPFPHPMPKGWRIAVDPADERIDTRPATASDEDGR